MIRDFRIRTSVLYSAFTHYVANSTDIIRSHGLSKSAVIAGIGARDYYKNKCDYELGKFYMIKNL